jgi:dihydrofolate synthase/folylpolyglutamate synthase
VAVIEAGLGGRYDATNVIPSQVQVLTNVGLEHTRWLGPTVADIAAEKLAVVRDGATLVVGAELHRDVEECVQAVVRERGATLVRAPAAVDIELLARGDFQRRNFALARTAAEAFLGRLDDAAVSEAAASTLVPGRFEVVDRQPETVFDGAHNPGGFAALAETLPAHVGERRLVALISVLDDKDAAAMLRHVIGLCHEVVFCANSNPRALPPATLQSLCGQLGGPPSRCEPDPRRALELARGLAGEGGVVLATGSIYLIADLLRPQGAGPGATL